ncbi:MAG: dihydrofolate reductase family protein [Paracoccaceae bacterium]
MARLVFAMNVSLDGYVDHDGFAPDKALFRHWIDQVRDSSASLYGRRLYEIMRYWDQDDPGWDADERAFARAWRAQPKWVVSATLQDVGPNATLVRGDAPALARELKSRLPGQIDVGGTLLAHSLGQGGLIDEYRLYYHPVVLGRGTPFFAGPRPELRITDHRRIGDRAIRIACVPA